MKETTVAHLSDAQFAEALAASPDAEAGTHPEQCAACRAELDRAAQAFGSLQAWSRRSAIRPAGFWYTQQQAIAEQLQREPQHSRVGVWAGAFAVLVFAAVMLGQAPITTPPVQAGAQAGDVIPQAEVDPDDALMAEIDASLRRPVPRAFEPALLVTQELHRAAEQNQATP